MKLRVKTKEMHTHEFNICFNYQVNSMLKLVESLGEHVTGYTVIDHGVATDSTI